MTTLFLIIYFGITFVLPFALLSLFVVEVADSVCNYVSKQNEKN